MPTPASVMPHPAGDDAPGRDARQDYRIGHPGELTATLCQLRDEAVPVHLGGPQGPVLTATLQSVDEAGRCLDLAIGGPGQAEDPRLSALEPDELTAVAYLANVKLQFDLVAPLLVRGPQGTTLRSGWPRELYRFQRRSAYRVPTLEHSAPTARLRHPSLPEMVLPLRVLDVSFGGCALLVPHEVPPLQPGSQLNGVHVELDAETRFEAGLRLQHATDIHPDQRGIRIGCEWAALTGGAQRTLQRYIDRTQKRRRQLALDRPPLQP